MRVTQPPVGDAIRLKMLVYGLTGVGKTVLCGSASSCQYTKPTLIVDIDGGVLTLSGLKVDVVHPVNLAELQDVYNYLRHDNTKYRSVCLDSITEAQRKLSLGEIMGDFDEEAAYTDFAKSTPADRYDWLRSAYHMGKVMRAFCDLALLKEKKRRIHVFMTALEKKDEARAIVCPSLPGQLGVECGAMFDILARLCIGTRTVNEKEVEQRCLWTHQRTGSDDITYLAKTRAHKLGRRLWFPDKPDLTLVFNRWMKEG